LYRKFHTSSKEYESRFNVVSSSENQSSSSTIASSSSSLNKVNATSATSGSTVTTNNLALNSNKNSPYHIIGLKNDTILPGNINVLTVLSPSTTNTNNNSNNNNTAYQISTYNTNIHHPQNHHQISYTNNSSNVKRLSNITVS